MSTPLTRQHFEAVAKALRLNMPHIENGSPDAKAEAMQTYVIAQSLAFQLAQFNKKFDRVRFIEACTGFPPEEFT